MMLPISTSYNKLLLLLHPWRLLVKCELLCGAGDWDLSCVASIGSTGYIRCSAWSKLNIFLSLFLSVAECHKELLLRFTQQSPNAFVYFTQARKAKYRWSTWLP
eukprot:scaffold1767_cov178-Ochromonas_danica.AAC.23